MNRIKTVSERIAESKLPTRYGGEGVPEWEQLIYARLRLLIEQVDEVIQRVNDLSQEQK